ncbi:MAG: hypothetical protein ACK4UJ_00915 [Leptonema sp. (in: bacteria)]
MQDKENPLRIGIHTLDELEEKVKAFRVMNSSSLKKRFILSRENVFIPNTEQILLGKGKEIDINDIKLLRKYFSGDKVFKTFQPDEGIVLVSDMNTKESIPMSMNILTQLMSIGKGAYEGFIDRVDNFEECLKLLKKTLFPKLMIIGYIPLEDLENEKLNLIRIRRMDQYLRIIEVIYKKIKPIPYFPKLKNITLDTEDSENTNKFILEIIREYNKGYLVEES